MSARRSPLGLVAAALFVALALLFMRHRLGAEGLDPDVPPVAVGPGDGSRGPDEASGAPVIPDVADLGERSATALEEREALTRAGHRRASGRVNLFILDENGAGLLDSAQSSLTAGVIFWLEPVLIEGRNVPATVPSGAKPIRRLGSRVNSTPGWYTSFERPPEEAHVALIYGDRILGCEPVQPGRSEVVLVVTTADIEALHCTVRGRIAGLSQAGHHVRVQPVGREGQVTAPILGAGEGENFEVTRIPPGRAQLIVRFDPSVLVQKLMQSANPGSVISLGSRVSDAEQWRFRLETLAGIRQPWLLMDLELVPGEERDLGLLMESAAGAVVLGLVDEAGQPIAAHSVGVRLLTAPGQAIPHPQSWTFENLAILHPLPVARVQFTVVQGDLGALLSVQPTALGPRSGVSGASFPETQAVLAPLSVVALSADVGARLLTQSGAEFVSDPRWSGGQFKGHRIDGSTMLVPAGSYRFQHTAELGALTSVQVAPGTFVDLRDSGVIASPLRPADRKTGDRARR